MELPLLALASLAGAGAKAALDGFREHRSQPAGLSDLLSWAFLVAPGTVLQKDGSFLAGFRFRGPDLASATAEELDALSRHFNDALLPLTDRWMLHVDAIRRPAVGYPAPGAFPDPLTRLLDEERRADYERSGRHFETESFLAVTHVPPPEIYSRLASHFVRGMDRRGLDWGTVVGGFERQAEDLERRLASVLKIERLGSDGLLTYLHECLTGLPHPVRTPPSGSYLDFLLGDRDLSGGWTPSIGGRAIRTVAVHGYPHASRAGMLDVLNGLGLAFRASHRLIPFGRQTAERAIRRAQLTWFRSRKGLGSWAADLVSANKPKTARTEAVDEMFLDAHASDMARDAAQAVAENGSGEVRFCAYTMTLVVVDREARAADQAASELAKTLNDQGFTARVETLNALEAWHGSLPGHGHPNLRRPLLSTRNLADLAPLTSIWPGLAHNPSPFFPPGSPALLQAATTGSTPFRLHLHDSDVGHTLVVGRTGGGKSTLVGLLCAQFQRFPGAQVFLFDVGYSGYLLAKGAGARHYDLVAGGPGAISFQPLGRLDEPAERVWASEWVEGLLALQGVAVHPPHRTALDKALSLVGGSGRRHRTLTELSVQLQHPELKDALRPYTLEGPFGYLLDADRDDLEDGPYQVFELRALMDLDERILLPVLTYLFHRVEQRLTGAPSLLVIEEAWLPLMSSFFAGRIKQWLLTLRKQNAAVVLVTQSLAQLYASPNRHVILESCPTRLLLPNPDAASRETAALYAELGLNPAEIEILARARQKRDYYFTSPRGRRLFELGLGASALAFLGPAEGMTLQETQRSARELMARDGSRWASAWLRERGLGSQADLYDRFASQQGAPDA